MTGTRLYTRSQNEIGVTVCTNKLQGTIDHYLRLRVAYVKSRETNGLRLDFGYWF